MAKTKQISAVATVAEQQQPQTAQVTIDRDEFVRTRDALVTSFVSLERALSNATHAYINHTNAILGDSAEPLDISRLDITKFLESAHTAAAVEVPKVEDGPKPKAKRVRKPKDPNAPKRPLTAYLSWLQDNRGQIQEQLGTNTGRGGISAEGTKRWNEAVGPDTKQQYKDRYNLEQAEYVKAMAEYKAKEGALVESPEDEDEEIVDAIEAPEAEEAIATAASTSDSDSSTDSEDEPAPPPKEPTPPPVKTPKASRKRAPPKNAAAEVPPASSPPLPAASSPVKSQKEAVGAFTAVNGKRKSATTKAEEAAAEPKKKRSRKETAAAAAAAATAPPESTPAETPKGLEGTPGTAKKEKRERKKTRKSLGGDA